MGKFIGHPVGGPRIVPPGKTRTTSDKLASGHPGFRVTQSFSAFHDGVDLGNYFSGDPIYAPHDGTLVNRTDTRGALITEIREADGMRTGFGHLSKFARAAGPVRKGQLVGYCGNTGQSSAPHIHMTRENSAGTNLNPWPLLEQNRLARINVGVNIRNAPSLTARIYGTTTATAYRDAYPSGWDWVKGGYHGIGAWPYHWRKLWINGAYRYVARPLVTLL
jgi:hypothetical protein